jgi:two-component system nitrogen regulation response regulator GlnG
VPALARFFLQKSAKELGVEPKRITDEALERLKAFSFPGNVRQLENICHWLTVMAPAQVIESKDLPPEILSQSPAGELSATVAPSTVMPIASGLPQGLPTQEAPAVSSPGACRLPNRWRPRG